MQCQGHAEANRYYEVWTLSVSIARLVTILAPKTTNESRCCSSWLFSIQTRTQLPFLQLTRLYNIRLCYQWVMMLLGVPMHACLSSSPPHKRVSCCSHWQKLCTQEFTAFKLQSRDAWLGGSQIPLVLDKFDSFSRNNRISGKLCATAGSNARTAFGRQVCCNLVASGTCFVQVAPASYIVAG